MRTARCARPIPFAALIEYWLGELTETQEGEVEEHMLGCGSCASELAHLAALGSRIRSAFREGMTRAVISAPLVEKMKREGMRVREYPVSPGGSVQCTLGASDDAVVGRLKVRLEGLSRLDLVCLGEQGDVRFRLSDIPFDPASGEVLSCPSAAVLRKMSAHVDRLRLLAVDENGERPIAEYTFRHTPS